MEAEIIEIMKLLVVPYTVACELWSEFHPQESRAIEWSAK